MYTQDKACLALTGWAPISRQRSESRCPEPHRQSETPEDQHGITLYTLLADHPNGYGGRPVHQRSGWVTHASTLRQSKGKKGKNKTSKQESRRCMAELNIGSFDFFRCGLGGNRFYVILSPEYNYIHKHPVSDPSFRPQRSRLRDRRDLWGLSTALAALPRRAAPGPRLVRSNTKWISRAEQVGVELHVTSTKSASGSASVYIINSARARRLEQPGLVQPALTSWRALRMKRSV